MLRCWSGRCCCSALARLECIFLWAAVCYDFKTFSPYALSLSLSLAVLFARPLCGARCSLASRHVACVAFRYCHVSVVAARHLACALKVSTTHSCCSCQVPAPQYFGGCGLCRAPFASNGGKIAACVLVLPRSARLLIALRSLVAVAAVSESRRYEVSICQLVRELILQHRRRPFGTSWQYILRADETPSSKRSELSTQGVCTHYREPGSSALFDEANMYDGRVRPEYPCTLTNPCLHTLSSKICTDTRRSTLALSLLFSSSSVHLLAVGSLCLHVLMCASWQRASPSSRPLYECAEAYWSASSTCATCAQRTCLFFPSPREHHGERRDSYDTSH